MTSPERDTPALIESPYSAEVEVLSKNYAFTVGEKAAAIQIESLEHLRDLFVEGGLDSAGERARMDAAERYYGERKRGLHNDPESRSPGIFITGAIERWDVEDFDKIHLLREDLESRGTPFRLESILHDNGVFELYALHLPEGAYTYDSRRPLSMDDIDYQEALRINDRVRIGADGRLEELSSVGSPGRHTRFGRIGRIEGAGGALWASPLHLPNGLPKPHEEIPSRVA